jgi:hypothetical protein
MLNNNMEVFGMKKCCKGKEPASLPVMIPAVLPAWSNQPGLKYGEAYVPPQRYTRTLSPAEGFELGTIFPELYSPYCG